MDELHSIADYSGYCSSSFAWEFHSLGVLNADMSPSCNYNSPPPPPLSLSSLSLSSMLVIFLIVIVRYIFVIHVCMQWFALHHISHLWIQMFLRAICKMLCLNSPPLNEGDCSCSPMNKQITTKVSQLR